MCLKGGECPDICKLVYITNVYKKKYNKNYCKSYRSITVINPKERICLTIRLNWTRFALETTRDRLQIGNVDVNQ